MNKITKMMAAVLCASAFLVALPSPSQADTCGPKILVKTETFCLDGRTYTKKHYSQTCNYDNGKTVTEKWVETDSRSGCIVQN